MKETAKKRSQRINELQKKLRSGSYMTVDEKKQLLQLVLKKIEVNKTQISKEDLMTKYKAAFDALKQDLKEAAQAYMKTYVFEQIKIKKNPAGRALVNKINKRYFDQHLAEKIGTALYKDYSFDEAQYLIDQHKKWIEAEYKKYLQEGEVIGLFAAIARIFTRRENRERRLKLTMIVCVVCMILSQFKELSIVSRIIYGIIAFVEMAEAVSILNE